MLIIQSSMSIIATGCSTEEHYDLKIYEHLKNKDDTHQLQLTTYRSSSPLSEKF